MQYSGNCFSVKHINRKNVQGNKERNSMRSIVGKGNKTECTFCHGKDLLQVTLSCLPPNKYTVERVGKYEGAVDLKKDILRYMMS